MPAQPLIYIQIHKAGTGQPALAEPCSLPAQVINHGSVPPLELSQSTKSSICIPLGVPEVPGIPKPLRNGAFPALCSAALLQQHLQQRRDPHSLLAGKTLGRGSCAMELPAALPGESISPLGHRLQVTAKSVIPPLPAADAYVRIQGTFIPRAGSARGLQHWFNFEYEKK